MSSGDYGSVSEVIRDAMRAWLQRERRLAALDARSRVASPSSMRGRGRMPSRCARSFANGSAPKVQILHESLLRAGGQARPPQIGENIGRRIRREPPLRSTSSSIVATPLPICRIDIRSCPAMKHWGIRRCVYGDYLIFYRVREDAVDIVHVLHGAMDYESMLFPDA